MLRYKKDSTKIFDEIYLFLAIISATKPYKIICNPEIKNNKTETSPNRVVLPNKTK